MKSESEFIYRFARRTPYTKAIWRVCAAIPVVGSCVLFGLWTTGVLSLADVVSGTGVLLIMALAWALGMALWERSRIVVTPNALIIKRLLSREEYPWEDVRTAKVETWRQAGVWDRLFAFVLIRSDVDVPYVKVVLRRRERIPIARLRSGTRVRGVAVPGLKFFRLFPDDPKGFVQDVQPFLQQSATPPPATSTS